MKEIPPQNSQRSCQSAKIWKLKSIGYAAQRWKQYHQYWWSVEP